MDATSDSGEDSQETNTAMSYNGWGIVKSHDSPHPEIKRNISYKLMSFRVKFIILYNSNIP